jgi:hypothetical protein
MQNYLLRKIYESLHDTYNSINEYQLFDNSNLDDMVNYENYKLMQEIINFSNVVARHLNRLKFNEIYIDDNKRKRYE